MASDGGNQWDDEPRIELRGDPAYRQRGVDYGAEPYMEEEVPQQRTPVRRFGPLRFALVGVALLVFAGLIFYAYSWGTGDPDPEELPVIAAPAGVEKEPPSNPGGMEVPYQDSMVLNPQAEQDDDVERLLPPPEEPQPREPAEESTATAASEGVQQAETAGESTAPAPGEEEAAEPETAAPEVAEETVVPETPTPDMQEPGTAAEQEAEPEAPQAEPAETETPEPEPQSQPDPAPVEEEAAPAEPEAPAAAATSGNFIIQLASASNRDAVEGEWANMQQRHPEQLGNLQLHIEQADLGERGTFYRLQAGPLSSREAAESLCTALQAQQQDCLVRAR